MPRDPRTRPLLVARIRSMLLEIYGPKCPECGCELLPSNAEVNHIYGREWKIRDLSSYNRHLRYWKEAQRGLINLLCKSCNGEYRPKREAKRPEGCPRFKEWLEGKEPF